MFRLLLLAVIGFHVYCHRFCVINKYYETLSTRPLYPLPQIHLHTIKQLLHHNNFLPDRGNAVIITSSQRPSRSFIAFIRASGFSNNGLKDGRINPLYTTPSL